MDECYDRPSHCPLHVKNRPQAPSTRPKISVLRNFKTSKNVQKRQWSKENFACTCL